MKENNEKPEPPKKPTKLERKVKECLSAFYDLMNDKAQELGLKGSHFAVAHGMHNENNYSTAYDMGRLSCLMMKDERFREIVKTVDFEVISSLKKDADCE